MALLRDHRIGDQPLCFVCHSMGGLVVKLMLRSSASYGDPYVAPIAKATRGIVFIATPHQGADLATPSRRFAPGDRLAPESVFDSAGMRTLAVESSTTWTHCSSGDTIELSWHGLGHRELAQDRMEPD